jgi:hypothetical protein
VNYLRDYKSGMIPIPLEQIGNVYDGPEYYVEFKDNKGIHSYLLGVFSDTLYKFNRVVSNLEDHPWEKRLVNSSIINSDHEIVTALKNLGLYQTIKTPHIPMP